MFEGVGDLVGKGGDIVESSGFGVFVEAKFIKVF